LEKARLRASHEQGEVIVQKMIGEHLAVIEPSVDALTTTEVVPKR
jgi:hypothetical protein